MKRSTHTDTNKISRDEFGAVDLDPFAVSEGLYVVWCDTHCTELGQGFDSLRSAISVSRFNEGLAHDNGPGRPQYTQRRPA